MKESVLITGVAGFLGSHVAKHLVDKYNVVGIDDLSGGLVENLPEVGVNFHQGSILDEELLDTIFKYHRPKYVFHLAADARENLSHFTRKFNYETNVIGSINIINKCVQYDVKCLVFTSSIAVMAGNTPPYHENEAYRVNDPYGNSKAAVEIDLNLALQMFGLNHIIFRPHNIFGENQNIGDKYRNVVGIFMNQIMRGEPLTIFGDGSQTRAFSYIDDVAPHIANCVEREECYNQIFNIGGEIPYSVYEIANMVCQEFGIKERNIRYLKERHEVKHAYSDHEKANGYFGKPKTSITEGIKKMADWAKVHGARESKPFEKIELTKNLPEGW